MRWYEQLFIFLFAIVFSLLIVLAMASAHEHDRTDPAWEATPPEVQEWYKGLMRPDFPTMSCCGESDAYWCDIIKVRDKKTYCTITDDRPDEPFKRQHVPLGTEIEIPNEKLKFDRGNPTGHAIVFLSSSRTVYCFVQGTGI